MGSRNNNDVATLSAVGSIRSRTISRLVRESRIGKVPRFINRVFAHPTPVAIFSDRAGNIAAIVGGDGVAWLKFVETRAKVGVGREEDDRHGVKSTVKWYRAIEEASEVARIGQRPVTSEDEVINLSRERLGTRPMQTPSSRGRTHSRGL